MEATCSWCSFALVAGHPQVVVIGGTVGGLVASMSSREDPIQNSPSTTNTTTTTNTTITAPDQTDKLLQPPWQDKCYYINNDLLIPSNETVVKFDLTSLDMTVGYLSPISGSPNEHWGFKPVSSNTTSLSSFRQSNNISVPVFLLYNRLFKDQPADFEQKEN